MLQGWLKIGAMGIFAIVLHLGLTNIFELLLVTFTFISLIASGSGRASIEFQPCSLAETLNQHSSPFKLFYSAQLRATLIFYLTRTTVFMITYSTINYSDIYDDAKPTKEQLLEGINSKIVIVLMAVLNSELQVDSEGKGVQDGLINFVTERFPAREKTYLFQKLEAFKKRAEDEVILWAKRYTLAFMKYEFLNYRDTNSINSTPEEEVRIFKAYLLICEELNEADRIEFDKFIKTVDRNDEFFFEKLVWPFVLKQFSTNNKVNPVSQFFSLLAFLKYSSTDDEIANSWRQFISLNGFANLREYLGSVHYLIKVGSRYEPDDKFLKIFSWIKSSEIPKHLLNLSFDISEFNLNNEKQIDYRGLREKPLFKSDENEFVILDIDYLNNKIYNGPLFDLYNQTEMAAKTRFKKFPDFKTHISSNVSENIIFKGIMKKLFDGKHVKLHFDDEGKDNYPDCYIRLNKNIFLIEFKDYLFPGKLVDEYSFEMIREHLELKFIKNQKGSNKGISQLVEQIKILSTRQFDFDNFTNDKIIIHPLIIHTNFTYQMPGINDYLNREFQIRLKSQLPELKYKVEKLVLIDIESFFDFLRIPNMNLNNLRLFLKRYDNILTNRNTHFLKTVNQSNFVRARSSFDEIYKTIFKKENKTQFGNNLADVLLNVIGTDEKILDLF